MRNPERKIHNAPMKEITTAAIMPARISMGKIIACGVLQFYSGVGVAVRVGVNVCVEVGVRVSVGRGVWVLEGVHVGGGVRGVRVADAV